MAKFRKDYDLIVLKEEAKKLMSHAKDTLGFVESYRKSQMSRAFDYLKESADIADNIRSNDALCRLPEVADFLDSFEIKYAETSDSLNEEIAAEEIKKAISSAMDALGFAEIYLPRSESQALDYFQQAKDKCEEILSDARFNLRREIGPFLEKFQPKADAFEKLYRDTVLTKEVKDAIGLANDNLSHAFTYFASAHSSQALDYYAKSKDYAHDVMSNDKFFSMPEVEAFYEQFEVRQKEFAEMYSAHVLAEEKKELLSLAKTHMDWTIMQFDRHDNGQAMENFQLCEQDLENIEASRFSGQPDVAEFVASIRSMMEGFRNAYDERVVSKEFADITENALQNVTNAEIQFKSAAYGRALEYLNAAKDYATQALCNQQLQRCRSA